MRFTFGTTLFAGAFLLFVVQPMIARTVLPVLGGTPAVWNTCVVFFQACLLAGYAYAHWLARVVGPKIQTCVHLGILLVAVLVLPMQVVAPSGTARLPVDDPTLWLLGRLILATGLPFFAVSATSPLLQRWFSTTQHSESDDPYFLYAASNAGSMIALLAYPFLVEPNLGLARQGRVWSGLYGIFIALCVVCAAMVWLRPGRDAAAKPNDDEPAGRVGVKPFATWCALAFIPSSLMLGVTTYLATDIASGPLLWIVPLGLYLLSFIFTFARRQWIPHNAMLAVLPFTTMILVAVLAAGLVWKVWIPVHLFHFFVVAMVCHGTLARLRPAPAALTTFYLALSVGGVLGGAFNALMAPVVFRSIAEYPLVMLLACLVLPNREGARAAIRSRWLAGILPVLIFTLTAAVLTGWTGDTGTALSALATVAVAGMLTLVCMRYRQRPIVFALSLGAVLLGTGLTEGVNGRLLLRERDFFGVVSVTATVDGTYHRLFHGSTLHGEQAMERDRRREPLTYFTRGGPVGQLMDAFAARAAPARVAVAGLGVGSLATYARPTDRWVFYEIDPAVDRIARDPAYFTYIRDSRAASVDVELGDARRCLMRDRGEPFRLLILDAFSSDAVPIHLMTREALRLYLARLAPGGLIAFNLSSRYLDLEPVVGALARDAGLACLVRTDTVVTPEEKRLGKQASIWAVMARTPDDFLSLTRDPRWHPARIASTGTVWTDDYSNLARHFRFSFR